ncbi:unnamed protein product [Linum tenue]|uniref:Uncharacterized protein n=1 Tax=Linum tenue TaxID=586396 RepID=A0AAV0PF52_9ROSI|nr:unnamed protein product [Linum tenue]
MTNMEDADVGRVPHQRRQGGRSNKQSLIRIHGGGVVNLGGLALFGGALAVGGLVATFIFRKTKDPEDNKKSTRLAGDQHEQQKKQKTSDKASTHDDTLEGNQAEAVAHETPEEINITPTHRNGDDTEASSSDESLPQEDDVEATMEADGGAEATKLNADKEISAGYDEELEEEDEGENRGEGEAFDPEIEAFFAGGAMTMPAATESNPKEEDESVEDELPSIKNEDGEGEEAATGGAGMNTRKTEDGVMEEVDGYVEDDDVDDMASEEEEDESNEETEKDELEMLEEGLETWTDSDSEAIIWPAETLESLAMAVEDQLTHLKKTATEGMNNGLNNSSRESESEIIIIEEEEQEDNKEEQEDNDYEYNEAGENSMLLEKPMMMVNGQIAELISRRIWIFPMIMLLLVMVLFLLLTRRNPSSYYQSNAI